MNCFYFSPFTDNQNLPATPSTQSRSPVSSTSRANRPFTLEGETRQPDHHVPWELLCFIMSVGSRLLAHHSSIHYSSSRIRISRHACTYIHTDHLLDNPFDAANPHASPPTLCTVSGIRCHLIYAWMPLPHLGDSSGIAFAYDYAYASKLSHSCFSPVDKSVLRHDSFSSPDTELPDFALPTSRHLPLLLQLRFRTEALSPPGTRHSIRIKRHDHGSVETSVSSADG